MSAKQAIALDKAILRFVPKIIADDIALGEE